MRDPDTGISKGFGFLGYDSFDASDEAIKAMNGQFLCNHAISVTYALKKDSKEKHGTGAERLLAANRPVETGPQSSYTAARFGTVQQPSQPAIPQMNPLLQGMNPRIFIILFIFSCFSTRILSYAWYATTWNAKFANGNDATNAPTPIKVIYSCIQ